MVGRVEEYDQESEFYAAYKKGCGSGAALALGLLGGQGFIKDFAAFEFVRKWFKENDEALVVEGFDKVISGALENMKAKKGDEDE